MHIQIKKACDSVTIERKVESVYCDLILRKEVVVYASAENRRFKTIPTGYDSAI